MKNHYEVLNLEKNCSAKDIKDSYIKLSKKYHPDKNKSPEAHKKFVEVNEAYSVLGKNHLRVRYDETLSRPSSQSRTVNYRGTDERNDVYEFYNPNGHGRNNNYNYEKSGRWNPKLKYKTLMYCCLLMAIGTGIRVLVIWREIKRQETRSHEISLMLNELKEKRRRLGKEGVIKEMQKTFQNNKVDSKKRPDK